MLMARPDALRHTPEEAQAMADQEAIAVVPLGIPLLAGPVRSAPSSSRWIAATACCT
ncbi:MAG: MarC family protein [Myxococcota bacterium]